MRIGLLLGLAAAGAAQAMGPEVGPEELRRGLVTTCHDPGGPTPAEVVRLEPTIALALKAGEAAHPRLRADGGRIVWKGYLSVVRGGTYRFAVRLRGRFRLQVGGKEVLAGEVKGERPVLTEGADVRLEAGARPLTAEFTRLPGAARVELFWQSPFFRREPLPYHHVGHLPAQEDARLAADDRVERGRFLAEEANCMRCHLAADDDCMARGLVPCPAPDLSRAGERLRPAWIERWLESPRRLRPGAVMPEMFPANAAGRVERYAVTRYLASLGAPAQSKPRKDRPEPDRARVVRGQRLFERVGCLACHGPGAERARKRSSVLYPPSRVYPLSGLGSKYTPVKLAAYLANSLAVDPSGRMPHLLLRPSEAEDLAHFLCASEVEGLGRELPAPPSREEMLAAFRRVDGRPEELMAFRRLPAEEQWRDLGKRLVIDRGCNNCHTIAPDGQPFASVLAGASLDDLKAPARQKAGCLADDPASRGKAPAFGFNKAEREALRAFLTKGLNGAGSPAPVYGARRDVIRFNCLACHSRDGEGGLAPAVVEPLRRLEKAESAEAVVPPPLTGVGHKLRTPWLRQVLLDGGRARPWMALRMPQFGEPNVGRLSEALAALDGTEPDETAHKIAATTERIEAGRQLVGKSAFGCVSCHDLAGVPGSGARGPDLAGMNRRVRYEWYRRWLEQPQRVAPGTRMPTVFLDGRSLVPNVLGGSAEAQAEALWAYLSLGPSLPLPEGLKPRPGPGPDRKSRR